MKKLNLTNREQLDDLMLELRKQIESDGCVLTIETLKKQRTPTQNRAMHQYFKMVASEMNDAGINQKELVGSFKDGFTLPVTPDMIKSIFRAVGLAMCRKSSTSKLTTVEMQNVYQVVDQRFGEITGISVAWPSAEPPVYK